MREVATGSIFEFKTDKVKSSSLTTLETVGKDNSYSYEKDRYLGQSYNGIKDFKNNYGSVVMLARNGKLAGTELNVDTKVQIKTAHNQGAEFVVGDMPGVDSQFIDYLQEIGAKFTIYHTGNTPRIQVKQTATQPSTIVTETKPTINLNVLLEELRDLEERKFKLSLKNETTEDNFIINHWIKVTPESVKEETGVKTGSGKDVSTSLLSKNGLTIDAAAERLGENFGYERGFTDQDIRNIIIDVLLAGSISNYLSIDKNAAGMQEINRRIKEITTQLETVKSTSLAAYTGHSGAAKGADTIWNKKGKEYGITKFIDYKVDTLKQLNETQKIKLETAYQQAVKDLGRKALPYDWLNPDLKDRNGKLLYYSGGLVRRDYIQAALSDGIFAISDIILPGEKGKEKNGIRYANKVKNAIVDGGTGYAVQMGINLNKPVYVFHQGTNADNITPVGWYKWDGANFIAIKTPILTTKFAGIGTQKINEAGKQAIDDVYQETFTNLADHPFKGCEI